MGLSNLIHEHNKGRALHDFKSLRASHGTALVPAYLRARRMIEAEANRRVKAMMEYSYEMTQADLDAQAAYADRILNPLTPLEEDCYRILLTLKALEPGRADRERTEAESRVRCESLGMSVSGL